MAQRPIKGNSSGKYNLNFIDPTNDICAYYNGMTQLQELVEQYLQTVTYHVQKPANSGESKLYGKQVKEEHYMDHCSVCLQKFKEGEQVKLLPCKHCFHKECVGPWFQNNRQCPNCRFQLPLQQ